MLAVVEERGAFIKNEKALREENHKRMLQHLEACYTRSDPSSCYRICFNCSFADTMSNRVRCFCFAWNDCYVKNKKNRRRQLVFLPSCRMLTVRLNVTRT